MNRNVRNENRDFLVQWSEKYKKVDSLSLACEDYIRKEYLYKLNLAQARLKFRERSQTMSTCKMDYPSDQQNLRSLMVCMHCPNIDVRQHWFKCDRYAEFHKGKSLDNDFDLVSYYQQIINLRKSEGKN